MQPPSSAPSTNGSDGAVRSKRQPSRSQSKSQSKPPKRNVRQSQQLQDGTTAATTPSSKTIKSSPLINMLMMGLGVCCLLSVSTNLLHHDSFVHHSPDTPMARAMMDFKRGRLAMQKNNNNNKNNKRKMSAEEMEEELIQNQGGWEDPEGKPDEVGKRQPHVTSLAGLRCEKYGGPSTKEAEEMVYWRDIPSDELFESPLKAKKGQRRQYLTFEPDGGGWNNIRMAMETIVGLAVAMGRTLILPPAQGMYLLKNNKNIQTTDFSFAHFFPMLQMAQENAALDVITMKEFLETEAMTGHLVDKATGRISFPPGNRTNWDGQDVVVLKEWMRNVTYIEHFWHPNKCLAAFPASGNHKDVTLLKELQNEVAALPSTKYKGHPVGVDAPPKDRLHENLAGRKDLCVYDEHMQSQLVVHFMCYHKMRIRYLVHFYAFLFFEDWREDLWMKRFMRDHMRYIDEIQCAAARIVAALRRRAKGRGWEKGSFDTMHIRRGDFQFKDTRIEADEILRNSKDVLTVNKTIFIATDEKNKAFFKPIREGGYDIVFLDDFKDLLVGVNTNYFGMIDQLVASRGDVFLGCWHSTFTGFIMRMRGYHSTKRNLPGNLEGVLPNSYYYANLHNKYAMHVYEPLINAFFNREFPTSWRQIDMGVVVNDDTANKDETGLDEEEDGEMDEAEADIAEEEEMDIAEEEEMDIAEEEEADTAEEDEAAEK